MSKKNKKIAEINNANVAKEIKAPVKSIEEDAIEWAFSKGIISADINGGLDLDKPMTKKDLVKALFIFKGLVNKE